MTASSSDAKHQHRTEGNPFRQIGDDKKIATAVERQASSEANNSDFTDGPLNLEVREIQDAKPNARMKTNPFLWRFRRVVFGAFGYFLLFALTLLVTQASAFHSSQIYPCKRSFKTRIPSRGIHYGRSNIAFDTRSGSDVFQYPVHVLRNYFRPQDNLFSGIAEIGMGSSIGVLYSEYFIILTGCGPPNFSDALERICYQGVIVYAGLALFNRIVTLNGLEETVENMFGPLQPSTLWQVRVAEYLSAAAVLGAVVALQVQYSKGATMDGLAGIDINMCRAIRGDVF